MECEKPWGINYGVRPVKHVLRMREEGFGDDEIRKWLKNEYQISDKKLDLMFLVAKDQETESLQCKILSEVSMADRVLLVLFDDFLPVIVFIALSCIYHHLDLIFHLDEELVSVRFSLDKFNSVSHQFHQTIIIRKLTLAVCNISDKRGIILDMSGNIDGSFYILIIVSATDVFFEQAFSHSRLEVLRKKKQQQIKQLITVVRIHS